jgi:hypothetical protein
MITLYVVMCTAVAACREYTVKTWSDQEITGLQCMAWSRSEIALWKQAHPPHESVTLKEYGCKVTAGVPT